MISDQVPKLIGDQFDRPSNVHGKRDLGITHKPPTLQLVYREICKHDEVGFTDHVVQNAPARLGVRIQKRLGGDSIGQ